MKLEQELSYWNDIDETATGLVAKLFNQKKQMTNMINPHILSESWEILTSNSRSLMRPIGVKRELGYAFMYFELDWYIPYTFNVIITLDDTTGKGKWKSIKIEKENNVRRI